MTLVIIVVLFATISSDPVRGQDGSLYGWTAGKGSHCGEARIVSSSHTPGLQ